MIIAFTGAGISKPSGIPTFEDMGDLRTKLDRQYARYHYEDYWDIIQNMKRTCDAAEPNDAHRALAEYNIPVITMNVDELHIKAGTQDILEVHGTLPTPVLYGDPAPKYGDAQEWVHYLNQYDIFLIVGISFYTNISVQLKEIAEKHKVQVSIINDNAEIKVRQFLEEHKDKIENFQEWFEKQKRLELEEFCNLYK